MFDAWCISVFLNWLKRLKFHLNCCYQFHHINFPFVIGIFASEVNKMRKHDEMPKNCYAPLLILFSPKSCENVTPVEYLLLNF